MELWNLCRFGAHSSLCILKANTILSFPAPRLSRLSIGARARALLEGETLMELVMKEHAAPQPIHSRSLRRPSQRSITACGPWRRGTAKLSNGAAKHLRRVFQHLDNPEESIDVVAREFHVHTLEYLAPMLVFARLDRARPLASCNPGSSALLLGRLAAGHGRGQRERHASAPVGDSG